MIWGSKRESQRKKEDQILLQIVALLCDFIDKEPSNYEEVTERKELKDAMIE